MATLHALVLGDVPTDLQKAAALLRVMGYEPTWQRVETWAEYLANLHPKYDVILADARAVLFDPRTALQFLQERGVDTPFLLITLLPADEIALECLRMGAADYVPQGRPDRLAAAVDLAVQQRQTLAQKRQAEESRRNALREWEAVFEAVNEAVSILDVDGSIRRANGAMRQLGHLEPGFSEGVRCWQAVHRTEYPPENCPLRHLREGSNRYVITQCIAGRWFQETVTPLFDAIGNLTGAILVLADISEHKAAEEQLSAQAERLQSLSRQLMEVQEHERRTLAKELHDEIGQALTAVHINLQAAQRCAGAESVATFLSESIALIEKTLQQVRDLSLDLRPSLLDDLGLTAALRWYVDRYKRRTGVESTFTADSVPTSLPADIATACFRVAQEALTNAARYAQASHIHVSLRCAEGVLELAIQDDGLGFDVESARRAALAGRSFGLLSMEERVRLAGGEFELVSQMGQGTAVRARFRLEEQKVS